MKYIFFTNIPAPYRISFYNELAKLGFNFEVYYQRKTESDRSWIINISELKHPFYIDSGFYHMFGRFHIHFNPRLIIKLLKAKDSEIIIGAAWNDVNVVILAFLKRMGILKSKLHFWSEANYLTVGARNDNKLKDLVRKYVYNSSKGAQLSSGKMTEITFEKWGFINRKFVPLPNTIEEDKFTITEDEIYIRYLNNLPIFFLPVRLTEKIKGIINFFNSIGDNNIRRGLFLIAGDGPDKEKIEFFIKAHNVGDNIKLLGYCKTEKLVSLYKSANVFVLPSFSDASPLTLIEALKMKLPLLVSDKCGNHFEALLDDQNGYLFDPLKPQTIKAAFESLMNRFSDWKEMGEISNNVYNEKFSMKLVIENFIKSLTENSFSNKYSL